MRKILVYLTLLLLVSLPSIAVAKSPVIEESYWHVPFDKKEEFLKEYSTYWKPFWEEIRKKGWVVDRIRIYSQRVHNKDHWTFKTVVKFKNYESIDKWLENRDNIARKLFPNFQNYKELTHGGKKLVKFDLHWDEFLRELNP